MNNELLRNYTGLELGIEEDILCLVVAEMAFPENWLKKLPFDFLAPSEKGNEVPANHCQIK